MHNGDEESKHRKGGSVIKERVVSTIWRFLGPLYGPERSHSANTCTVIKRAKAIGATVRLVLLQ